MSDIEAKLRAYDEIQARCRGHVERICTARTVQDFFAAVRIANELIDRLELADRRAQFGTDNGYADIRAVGDVAEADNAFIAAISGPPVSAATVADALGLNVDAVRLTLYYLHKFGCVERTKAGRSFLVRLVNEDIPQGAVANNWTAIQPRRWPSDSEPIESGRKDQAPRGVTHRT